MKPDEKRDLAKAERIISRFLDTHPLKEQDFDPDGQFTEEATERFRKIFKRIMPEKAFRALEKSMFELQVGAVMDELVAIGALEYGPIDNGMPTYQRVRDWTDEEAERASARADARLRKMGRVREDLFRLFRPI
jgi:hypothetical protein